MKIFVLISLIAFSGILSSCGGGAPKIQKLPYHEYQARALKMNNKGAIAAVGIAVMDANRHDQGITAARLAAMKKLSEQQRVAVKATSHKFSEAIGIGKGSEHNDVLTEVIDAATMNLLKGAHEMDQGYYQTKDDIANGTSTYVVLMAVNPKIVYKSIENGLRNNKKASKANLYQRYVDSQAKKEHDKNIADFEKRYGVE